MVQHQFRRFDPFQDHQDAQVHDLLTNQASVHEQDTVPLAALHASPPAVPHKVGGNLSTAVQRMIHTGLARLQDPQPEGLSTRGLKTVKAGTNLLGMFPLLTLTNACGLLIVSCSYYLSILQFGSGAVEFFFLLGLLFIFVPNLARLLSPAPSRVERICLLCGLGMFLYLLRFMTSPLRFAEYDEFLHWRTANDILRTGHFFSANSMLPVGPYYPGLQIVTNAVSTISGLDTFHAAILVISAARFLMILSLFLLYEQVTHSSRMAGIATIIYMVNPHFLFFDSIFSYESLALPLSTFMFSILARYQTANKGYRWALFIACFVLLAITITHHMTDYVFDGLLILWAVTSLFQASSRNMRRTLVTIALFGVLLSLAYAFLLQGNPVWQYLSSYFGAALNELGHIIAGTSTARPLFINPQGGQTPLWDRLMMAASVAIVALGLPFGLLSLWQHYRHDALSVMLGLASFAYPITQVFRFTDFGSEIADRSAAFLFIPIAYVLTILIAHFWPTRKLSWKVTSLVTCALSVVFVGGVILDSGPGWRVLPGPYKVVADERSIEPESIQAALWSLAYLGPDQRVATDRINQIVMNTFGDQNIVTSQADHVAISPVFFSSQFDPEDVAILQSGRIRYLVVDLRLSTSLPLQGFYYENFESGAYHHTSPISRAALTKFNTIPQINRLFDSGNIVIYGVGAIGDGSSH